MDIIYLGHSSFKITGKNASVVTDPFDPKMVGLKLPKTSADIVTLSHDHEDHNFVEGISDVHKVIQGPGEYEVREISMIGIPSFHDQTKGSERGKNTIFVFELEGFRVVHLGDLGHTLDEATIEAIGDTDVLFVPCGGKYTLNAEEALAVTRAISPKIVIPMHYKADGLNDETFAELQTVESFVEALGQTPERMKKYSIKAGTVITDELKLIILDRA